MVNLKEMLVFEIYVRNMDALVSVGHLQFKRINMYFM